MMRSSRIKKIHSLISMTTALCCSLFAGSVLAQQSITVLLPGSYPDEIIKEFTDKTGIVVEQQTLAWDQLQTRIITALAAGTAPADVIELDWSWVGQFGAAGWLLPLDGKLDGDSVDATSILPIFKYDGKTIGMPYLSDFKMLVVNKDHLARAGIASSPRTIDELLAAGRTIKEKGIVKYPFNMALGVGEATSTSWYLFSFMYGGRLFNPDGSPAFTEPDSAGYKAMEFIKILLDEDLVDPASTSYGTNETREAFRAGDTSFLLAAEPGPIAIYNDPTRSRIAGNASAELIPTLSGTTITYGLPEALAIPATAKNQEAAIQYINFVTSEEIQQRMYELAGYLPARNDSLQALNEKGALQSGDAIVKQAITVEPLFEDGTPPWYPAFSTAAASAINALAVGQGSVDEAIASIAKAAQSAKADY